MLRPKRCQEYECRYEQGRLFMMLARHSLAPLFLYSTMSVVTCNVVNEETVNIARGSPGHAEGEGKDNIVY
jgi:hypothetical protein